MNRRNFLKGAIGAVVGAAAAVVIGKPKSEEAIWEKILIYVHRCS